MGGGGGHNFSHRLLKWKIPYKKATSKLLQYRFEYSKKTWRRVTSPRVYGPRGGVVSPPIGTPLRLRRKRERERETRPRKTRELAGHDARPWREKSAETKRERSGRRRRGTPRWQRRGDTVFSCVASRHEILRGGPVRGRVGKVGLASAAGQPVPDAAVGGLTARYRIRRSSAARTDAVYYRYYYYARIVFFTYLLLNSIATERYVNVRAYTPRITLRYRPIPDGVYTYVLFTWIYYSETQGNRVYNIGNRVFSI